MKSAMAIAAMDEVCAMLLDRAMAPVPGRDVSHHVSSFAVHSRIPARSVAVQASAPPASSNVMASNTRTSAAARSSCPLRGRDA